jgi:hypothetical protein
MEKIQVTGLKSKFIVIGFFIIAAFLMFAVVSISSLNNLRVNGPVYQQIVQGKDLIADILPPPEYIIEAYLTAFQVVNETNPKMIEELEKKIDELHNEYVDRHTYWENILKPGQIKTIMIEKSYKSAVEFFALLKNELMPALKNNNRDKAKEILNGSLKMVYDAHRAAIDEVVTMTAKRNSEDEKSASSMINNSYVIMTLVTLVIAILLIIIAIYVNRGIESPLVNVSKLLDGASSQIADAASQISISSQSISQGASEQASSLENTSSSLNEIDLMIKKNADDAEKANKFSVEARNYAMQGNKDMDEMKNAMNAIMESSNKITNIIKTIEEIAFQTNLLALNAAVEAARAGEYGKGFAVVAEEVRNLAKRSAIATQDITKIIQENMIKTKEGDNISQKTGESLKTLTGQLNKVAEIISNIAAASKNQANEIGQITTAMSQMNQVTQQNASVSEEAAASSEELSGQAEILKKTVIGLMGVLEGSNATIKYEYDDNR